jgi:hypothetical protein
MTRGWQRFIEFAHAKNITDTRIAESPCPHCGKGLDGATGEGDAVPKVGALGVCCYCGGLIQYGAGLVHQGLTEAELRGLTGIREETVSTMLEMRDAIRAAMLNTLFGKRGQS